MVNRPLVRDYPPETYTAYTILAGSVPLMLISTPAALAQDWGAISVLGWLAIVYMVVRPPEYLEDVQEREIETQAAQARLRELEARQCPHCQHPVERDYMRCPGCLRKLRERCESCSRCLGAESASLLVVERNVASSPPAHEEVIALEQLVRAAGLRSKRLPRELTW